MGLPGIKTAFKPLEMRLIKPFPTLQVPSHSGDGGQHRELHRTESPRLYAIRKMPVMESFPSSA